MRPTAALAALAVLVVSSAAAGELERAVEARWRGAWVLAGVETRSDCAGAYTNNRLNGRLAVSSGRYRFEPGELAQVDRLDLKRSRIDLKLSLPEPLLTAYEDGPFTLYRPSACRVELEVELPSRADAAAIDRALSAVLQRHESREAAADSDRWNGRQVEPYPPDYERTLAHHAAWKAEQVNATVQAGLEQARDEAARALDRFLDDPDYLAGFAEGIGRARAEAAQACEVVLDRGYPPPDPPDAARLPEPERRRRRGFLDGMRLVRAVEAQRILPGCFVEVPGIPE